MWDSLSLDWSVWLAEAAQPSTLASDCSCWRWSRAVTFLDCPNPRGSKRPHTHNNCLCVGGKHLQETWNGKQNAVESFHCVRLHMLFRTPAIGWVDIEDGQMDGWMFKTMKSIFCHTLQISNSLCLDYIFACVECWVLGVGHRLRRCYCQIMLLNIFTMSSPDRVTTAIKG